MPIPADSAPLPPRPAPGQKPWYGPRDLWDDEVERRLMTYLSPEELALNFAGTVGSVISTTEGGDAIVIGVT